jgi:hypothetical protein
VQAPSIWCQRDLSLVTGGLDFAFGDGTPRFGTVGFGGASQNLISPALSRERLRGGDYAGADEQLP